MKSLGQRVHAYKRCFVSGPGACPPKTQTRPLSASPSAPQTTADPITTASSSCPRVSCTENHAGSFVVWAPSAQRHRESHLQSHMSVVHASLLLSRLRRVPVSHWFFLFFVFVFVFLAIRNTAALDVCRSQYCDYGLSFLSIPGSRIVGPWGWSNPTCTRSIVVRRGGPAYQRPTGAAGIARCLNLATRVGGERGVWRGTGLH